MRVPGKRFYVKRKKGIAFFTKSSTICPLMKSIRVEPMRRYLQKAILICLFIGLGTSLQGQEKQNYITYTFSGGRFGDNLIAYLHAKWFSYESDVPLLYKPFPYSSQLALHDCELLFSSADLQYVQQINMLRGVELAGNSPYISKLYVCPYFPECQWERENTFGPYGGAWSYFDINWKDPGFRAVLKEVLAPKQIGSLVTPPKDTINIAIHLRNGGTYDQGDFALHFLTKFPSLDFYAEGLLQIIALFPNKPLYCYLFTDAVNPGEWAEKIRSRIPPEVPICFDFRAHNNTHDQNILEDFFSLFLFDVLIHPQSNFSLIPPLIHDYAVVYAPLSGCRVGGVPQVDRIKFEVNPTLYEELLQR